jgi:hypothetical protein
MVGQFGQQPTSRHKPLQVGAFRVRAPTGFIGHIRYSDPDMYIIVKINKHIQS